MEDLRIHGVVDLYDTPAGEHAAFFHLLPEPPGGGYKSQGTDVAECFFLPVKQPCRQARKQTGSSQLRAFAAASFMKPRTFQRAMASRRTGEQVVQGMDQRAADSAQPAEVECPPSYPVQMNQVGLFHLGEIKSHAEHVEGKGKVLPFVRKKAFNRIRRMAAQGVRRSSWGGPFDFNAFYFFFSSQQQDGFQTGNISGQGIVQTIRGGTG
ncbi:hypothetical protein HMPREF3038_01906 [Akkermansia sp. KLE1797]|nr:hypothetical protein HMPREF3038_01906 [Akkermansia sp. KLE1797]KXU54631.1 hypothetical protein HMPREF3039_01102 [Akkermansia sp. KLE1798]KZA05976.1 hypothetical protein HMPREF1326_00238 [Akkermansia sp. KLE1605]